MIKNVLAALIQVGFEGLKALILIAEKDLNGLQDKILEVLI
jgi:hypothetical protein